MNYVKEIWSIINSRFEGNPIMLFLSMGILYIAVNSFKAIPQLIKWKRGEMKKDREERDKARKELTEIGITATGIHDKVKIQTEEMIKMNGTLKSHTGDSSIHTPKSELVTSELFNERTNNINDSIKAIFNKMDNVK